jgi:hypothetical protein
LIALHHYAGSQLTMPMKLLKILLVLLILCHPQSEAGTVSVRLDYESHSKGAASKAEGGDLLARAEALKKKAKQDYRLIDSLIDDEVPTSAAVFREQLAKHQQDLNQLRGLRKQLKAACKFSKDELENCKVRLKPKEGEDGMQTDSSCEDGISREDWAFNKGLLKGVGPGIVAALKGSVEGLYHLTTSPVSTIEGLVEFLENIDELPGLLAASLEELEGMDPEQQGEAIAKFITEQVFTFANPVSKTKLLQQAAKTKLGAAAVKVGTKAGNIKFHSAEELARRLGVSKDKIHGIKETILKDLKRDLKKEIERLGARNPDIYVDGAGNIVLKNLETKKTLITSIPLDSYKP